jgi:hypothetical protein
MRAIDNAPLLEQREDRGHLLGVQPVQRGTGHGGGAAEAIRAAWFVLRGRVDAAGTRPLSPSALPPASTAPTTAELVEARQDAPPTITFLLDAAAGETELPPILLAVSDNGPQMTSRSTREFMAMCDCPDFGPPGTPTDHAWIKSLFSHINPTRRTSIASKEPELLRGRARRDPPAIQHDPTARRNRIRQPQRRTQRPRARVRAARRRGLDSPAGARDRIASITATKPAPEPHHLD